MTNTLNLIVRWIANAVLDVLAAVHLDSPNRIVIALSPAFVAAAGFVLALVARYLPFAGHYLTPDQLVNVFEIGAGLAAAKILVWLHGWQKHEARQAIAVKPIPGPPGPPGPVGETGEKGEKGDAGETRVVLASDPAVPPALHLVPTPAEDPAAQAA